MQETTVLPLVLPKSDKDLITPSVITWLNDQLEERQLAIKDAHGDDPVSEYWDEPIEAFLDAIVWAWFLSQNSSDEGPMAKELLRVAQTLGRHVLYMRAAERGGVEP